MFQAQVAGPLSVGHGLFVGGDQLRPFILNGLPDTYFTQIVGKQFGLHRSRRINSRVLSDLLVY